MKRILMLFLVIGIFSTCDFKIAPTLGFKNFFNRQNSMSAISAELEDKNSGNLDLIISNNSNMDILISEESIPLDNFERDVFKINNGDGYLPYTGRLFYIGEQPINWFEIKSGESLNIPVYLPVSYNFDYPDNYEIYFEATAIIQINGITELIDIVSDAISIKIDTESVSFQPSRAEMKPCSTTQRSLLARGKRISKADVANARAYLAKKKADNYYVKWFGRYTSARFNTVVNGYAKTTKSYNEGWKYSCETKANGGCNGWAAYVYKGQPYKVWVCMDYYEKTSDRDRGTLMTHEASHWNVNFGADDHGYGYSTGITLAKSDPNKAVDCANNIEYYTDDIPDAGTNPPVDPPVDPPGDDDGNIGNKLLVRKKMLRGQYLISENKKYEFRLQKSGNVVLLQYPNKVLWHTDTHKKGGVKLKLQGDGNLVLYTGSQKPVWASDTVGKNAKELRLKNTGKLVLYGTNNTIIWSKPGNSPDPDPDPPVDPPDNTTAWKFVVGGDTRSNNSAHISVLTAVKRNTPNYKVYLNSGDVVNTGTSSNDWRIFSNAVSEVLGSSWYTKYLASPGNHDMVRKGGLSNWNKYLHGQAGYRDRGRNFAYKYKNATFIILDADVSKSSQASWIQTTVRNAKTTWVFATWHYPNYYSEWIKALGNFDGVFFGHEHKYRRENKGSYFGLIVGTGGAPLGSGASYGYLECTVSGNKMRIKFIKASNGAVLDSATYTANNK